MEETYIITVFDCAKKKETPVRTQDLKLYNTYRRTHWNIQKNEEKYRRHCIPFSSLRGDWNTFHEFAQTKGDPLEILLEREEIELLYHAINSLSEEEQILICQIYFKEHTESQAAQNLGIPRTTLHYQKTCALKKLRHKLRYA